MHNNRADIEDERRRENDIERTNLLSRPVMDLLKQGKLEEAITSLNFLFRILHKEFPLVRVRIFEQLSDAYEQLDEKSQSRLTRKIKLDFGIAADNTRRAQAIYDTGFNEVPEFYQELCEMDPFDKMFPLQLAKAYEDTGEPGQALQVLMERIKPEDEIYAYDPRAYAQAFFIAQRNNFVGVLPELSALAEERGVYIRPFDNLIESRPSHP